MEPFDQAAGYSPNPATSERGKILLVEPNPGFRERVERLLARAGYGLVLAPDKRAALEVLRSGTVDLVLAELGAPELDGLDLLETVKARMPDLQVMFVTTFVSVEEAVAAMKKGAHDVITRPFDRSELLKSISEGLERYAALTATQRALQQPRDDLLRQGGLIGVSPGLRTMIKLIEQVASSSATVLIHGENGVGKELVARAIHTGSARRDGPFVEVNCAAIPEELFESELFGNERGAFPGPVSRRQGKFELGAGGTLFLNEVENILNVTVIPPRWGACERTHLP